MNEFGTNSQRRQSLIELRNQLNSTSPSFCIAKWKQVTIHLATGQTHSCHHPVQHKIPLEEIKIDVSALHNTQFKKEQQKMMLKGERPAECDYCWRVEDSDPSGDVFSDRIMKSSDNWAKHHYDTVSKTHGNINPSYLEVSFANTCNFKCSYCTPESSSQWLDEIRKYGHYPTSTWFNNLEWLKQQNKYPILEKDINPYVDAFWEWWPQLYPDLEVLRITGGEPLLTKNTFKVLDYVLQNPRPDLELNINSNLCISDKVFNDFIDKMKRIQDAGAIKSFKLYTSCEATGDRAEYIRYGLEYNRWLDNCHKILQIPNTKLTVMSTYNALSVTSYKDFLKDMLALRTQYSNEYERHPTSIDIPYLRWPNHQAIDILTSEFLPMVEDQVTYMYHNQQVTHWPPLCGIGYYDYEINRMERVYKVFSTHLASNTMVDQHRKDFVIFVDEHDRRRGTNFLKTFPEMEEFYNLCKRIK
jgi:organic radical activating enzyme